MDNLQVYKPGEIKEMNNKCIYYKIGKYSI